MSLDGLDAVEVKVMAAFAQGGREAMEDLKSLSQDEVPYDQGDLSRSAKVSSEERSEGWVGGVSYDTPYAAAQHENRGWTHQDGRKAGYLGDPMRANAERYQAHIAAAVKEAME
ncbi:minor capsid protein [Amycolatopsis sp. BJA-103]|uniref:minor capsid protein n=1 Tax=Amycolatopsis sp. BJA-103 TaxID=1911175 RepID=UPI000C782DFC|nr:minor capsid protein [Amycolatopsis sp. BJA-103]